MILNTEWNEHRKQAERASSRLSESDEQTSPDDHPDTDIRRLVFGMTLNDRLGSQIGDYGGSSSDTIHVAPTTTNDSTEDPIFDVSGLVAAVDVIVNDTKAKTAHKGSENLKKVPVIGSIVRPLKNAVELKLSGAINHIATTKAMNRLKKAQGDLDSIQTRIVGTDTEILESHEDLQTSIVTIRQEVEFIKRDVPNVQALRSEVLRALDEAETSLQSRVCNLGDPSHSEKEMTPLRFNSGKFPALVVTSTQPPLLCRAPFQSTSGYVRYNSKSRSISRSLLQRYHQRQPSPCKLYHQLSIIHFATCVHAM